MASVLCTVLDPDTAGIFRTVEIQTANSHAEYVEVPTDFVREERGRHYLAVSIAARDQDARLYLIQLPFEADSGANRLWVPESSVLQAEEVVK